MHSKASAYVKDYNEKTNWVYFLIKDDELLNKCNTIWDKINDTKIELNDKPVHNKKFLKTGTKFYVDEATDFLDKEVFRDSTTFYFWSVWKILSTCVFKWMQVNWKRVIRCITDDPKSSSDASDEE